MPAATMTATAMTRPICVVLMSDRFMTRLLLVLDSLTQI
jgi:hypothetical protein